MSRIEQALGRAANRADDPLDLNRVADSEVFDSPWSFDQAAVVPIRPSATPRSFDDRAAVPEPFPQEQPRFTDFSPVWKPKLVVADESNPILVEQFRALAATLHQAQVDHGIKVVLLTSAEPGEGKSLTAVNLALTLSGSYGRRVLLMDADLRRPSLDRIAQLPGERGLGEALKAVEPQKVPLYHVSESLVIAPAGRPDANPMSVVTSPRMQELISDARARFDWVLIDAPPLGPIADATLLAPLAEGVLLVVRAGRTHYTAVQKAVETLGRERVMGVVLNDADAAEATAYGNYAYDYGTREKE